MGDGTKLAVCCACLLIPLMIIVTLAMFGLSIAEIVMGAKYLHDCPKEKLIPIYLIVMGVFGILSSCSGGNNAREQRAKNQGEDVDENDKARCCRFLGGIIGVFLLAWFICGHVWVFRNEDYTEHETDANGTAIDTYCNHTLYEFAFWSIVVRWIVVACFVALSCCMCFGACCCAMCFARQDYEPNTA